jgi:two-component system LytT family response regulator
MNMIKTILVDDEPIALDHLSSLVTKYCTQLEICGKASTVEDALEHIYTIRPELVLLDIELAGENSFDLLNRAKNRQFEVIFVTAHEQFGIAAIKHDATDYILKPLDKSELVNAVEKAAEKIYKKRNSSGTPQLSHHSSRLALPAADGLLFVDTSKIICCESEGRYTWFYLADNDRKILVSKNLGEYEALLPSQLFVRIHHHSIVNISYIEKYVKGRGGHVIMKNGKTLEVSARKKEHLFEKLEA